MNIYVVFTKQTPYISLKPYQSKPHWAMILHRTPISWEKKIDTKEFVNYKSYDDLIDFKEDLMFFEPKNSQIFTWMLLNFFVKRNIEFPEHLAFNWNFFVHSSSVYVIKY